jgi:hypothetical protein
MRPGTTEEAIFVCFKSGLFAHYSLNRPDRLALPPFPISFIHGNRDWVNSEGGEIIVRNVREKGGRADQGKTCQMHIIPNADH